MASSDYLETSLAVQTLLRNLQQLQKQICVSGDMSLPQLGISNDDLQRLHREVDIVIHAAPTVRFDEPIHVTVNINTLGTQQIIQMCMKMKQLKSVVHVSTAYSNPGMSFVEEKVQAPVSRTEKPSMLWLLGIEHDKRKLQVINIIRDLQHSG